MKRLAVCCEGTWNRPGQIDRGVAAPTNVAKIALALADEDDGGNRQLLHYQAGVGTRRGERVIGGWFGIGLSRNVQECYRFLVDNYAPGDELYFFGFSRGAFTARSLVGLVRNSGILRREHRHRIRQAYALYRDPRRDSEPSAIAAELFRRSYSHSEVYIEFVGVWDTVGALGIPIDGFRPPLLSRLWTFHDTRLSRYVRWRLPRAGALGDPASVDGREGPRLWARVQAGLPAPERDGSAPEAPPGGNRGSTGSRRQAARLAHPLLPATAGLRPPARRQRRRGGRRIAGVQRQDSA
jgi:uncharacterized protein (DUF2235 family)